MIEKSKKYQPLVVVGTAKQLIQVLYEAPDALDFSDLRTLVIDEVDHIVQPIGMYPFSLLTSLLLPPSPPRILLFLASHFSPLLLSNGMTISIYASLRQKENQRSHPRPGVALIQGIPIPLLPPSLFFSSPPPLLFCASLY